MFSKELEKGIILYFDSLNRLKTGKKMFEGYFFLLLFIILSAFNIAIF